MVKAEHLKINQRASKHETSNNELNKHVLHSYIYIYIYIERETYIHIYIYIPFICI